MNNNKSIIALFLIAICVIASTSCKKTKTAATGTFYFHIHSNIDTNEVENASKLYADANGRHIGLSVAQFYISGIMLQNANGSMYTIPDAYILKDIDSEEYIMGTAPIGTYTSVMFNVGVDAAANATNPSSHAASSALSKATMWYGTTTQVYVYETGGNGRYDYCPNGNKTCPFLIRNRLGQQPEDSYYANPQRCHDAICTHQGRHPVFAPRLRLRQTAFCC